jgi:hypothetical protein
VIVGELRGAPGLQYRAPHMRVLALADSAAARRVARRRPVLVLPEAGLEAYAREHGVQLRPGNADRPPATEARRPALARAHLVAELIERLGQRVRRRAPRTWTIALLVALSLVASAHLSVLIGWRALVLAVRLLPRLVDALVLALAYPIEAVLTAVVAVVLLVTAWVWVTDLVRGVVQL